MVRPFPVVDDASSVGSQVGEPAACHESIEQSVGTILDKVRTVNEHDAGVVFARSTDSHSALVNLLALCIAAISGCRCGVDKHFLKGRHAVAFGERQHF